MKTKPLIESLLVALFTFISLTQVPQKVKLNLKNRGKVAGEFRFLERYPTDKYPNVFTAHILPGQSYPVELKIGTSLAQVTQSEINDTMRGQNVKGRFVLVVKAEDDGKTIELIP